jgi:hypothetical protein
LKAVVFPVRINGLCVQVGFCRRPTVQGKDWTFVMRVGITVWLYSEKYIAFYDLNLP